MLSSTTTPMSADPTTGIIYVNGYALHPTKGYVGRSELALRAMLRHERGVVVTSEGYVSAGHALNESVAQSFMTEAEFALMEHYRHSGPQTYNETRAWNMVDELHMLYEWYGERKEEHLEARLRESVVGETNVAWVDRPSRLFERLTEDIAKVRRTIKLFESSLKTVLHGADSGTQAAAVSAATLELRQTLQTLRYCRKKVYEVQLRAVDRLDKSGMLEEGWFDDLTDKASQGFDAVRKAVVGAGERASDLARDVAKGISSEYSSITDYVLTKAREALKAGLKYVIRVVVTPIVMGKHAVQMMMSDKLDWSKALGAMTLASAIVLGSAIPYMGPVIAALATMGESLMPDWLSGIVKEAEAVTDDAADKVLQVSATILTWTGSVVKDMFASPRNAIHSIVDIVALLLQIAGPATGGLTTVIAMAIEIVHGTSYFVESMLTDDEELKWECWLVGGLTLVLGMTGMHFALVGAKASLRQGAKVLAKEAAANAGKVTPATLKRVITEALPRVGEGVAKAVAGMMEFIKNPLRVILKLAEAVRKTRLGEFLFGRLGGKKALQRAEKDAARMAAHNGRMVAKEGAESAGKQVVDVAKNPTWITRAAKGTETGVQLGMAGAMGYSIWQALTGKDEVTALESAMLLEFDYSDDMPDIADVQKSIDRKNRLVKLKFWQKDPVEIHRKLLSGTKGVEDMSEKLPDMQRNLFRDLWRDTTKKLNDVPMYDLGSTVKELDEFVLRYKYNMQSHEMAKRVTEAFNEIRDDAEFKGRSSAERMRMIEDVTGLTEKEIHVLGGEKYVEKIKYTKSNPGIMHVSGANMRVPDEYRKFKIRDAGISRVGRHIDSTVGKRMTKVKKILQKELRFWKTLKRPYKVALIVLIILGTLYAVVNAIPLIGGVTGGAAYGDPATDVLTGGGSSNDTLTSTSTSTDGVEAEVLKHVKAVDALVSSDEQAATELLRAINTLTYENDALRQTVETEFASSNPTRKKLIAALDGARAKLDKLAKRGSVKTDVPVDPTGDPNVDPVSGEFDFFEHPASKTIVEISGRVSKPEDEEKDADARLSITIDGETHDDLEVTDERDVDGDTLASVFKQIYASLDDDYSADKLKQDDRKWSMLGSPDQTVKVSMGDRTFEFFLVMRNRRTTSLRKSRFDFKRSLRRLVMDSKDDSTRQREAPQEGVWKVTNLSDKGGKKKDTLFFVYRMKQSKK